MPPGLQTASYAPSVISQASTSRVPYPSSQSTHRINTLQSSLGTQSSFGWVLAFDMVEEASVSQELFHSSPQWDVGRYMLIDSGASVHVCPPEFAVEFPIIPMSVHPTLRGVNNNLLKIYGKKKVQFKLSENVSASAEFIVVNCNHAILSATSSANRGFTVSFDPKGASLGKEGIHVPLHKFQGLYYLCPDTLIQDNSAESDTQPKFTEAHVMAITPHSKGNDFWEIQEDQKILIRHHKRARRALFFPKMASDIPVSLELVSPSRQTHVNTLHQVFKSFKMNGPIQ